MKKNKQIKKQPVAAAATPVFRTEPKAISQVARDVRQWKSALSMAQKYPEIKRFQLFNLYDDVLLDALLQSQINNRRNKSLSQPFTLYNAQGEAQEELTESLQNQNFIHEINRHILDSLYFGHSLFELGFSGNTPTCSLIARQNVDPFNGLVYPDYSEDKAIKYRDLPEYGTRVLEVGNPLHLGLINSAIPHVLFKRFAHSCWSELCEIFGIPPRVLKTNTRDLPMLNRAEAMMRDQGAAAWYIIDQGENFEFASPLGSNGEVYSNLIKHCNQEMSMLISGAIIGQDTQHGTRGKEQVSEDVLKDLVNADLSLIEQAWNSHILTALQGLGIIGAGEFHFKYDPTEDLAQLWSMTRDILPYKKVDDQWIRDKFGIEVIGERSGSEATPASELSLKAGFDPFG